MIGETSAATYHRYQCPVRRADRPLPPRRRRAERQDHPYPPRRVVILRGAQRGASVPLSLGEIVQRLSVHAHPGARQERVELLDPTTLAVWVRARAVEGQANAAIEQAIASALHLRPREVKVVAGGSSRRKIVEIALSTPEALHERLVAYGLL